MDKDTSVKVAVRIRPLSTEEQIHEPALCLGAIPEESQVQTIFTFNSKFYQLTQLFWGAVSS